MAKRKNGNGNGKQRLYWIVATAVGICGLIAVINNFVTTESEGQAMRVRTDSLIVAFTNHVDWGNDKYKELTNRFDKIDTRMEIVLSKQEQILILLERRQNAGK